LLFAHMTPFHQSRSGAHYRVAIRSEARRHLFRQQILEETIQESIAGVVGLPRLGKDL
jgi:hypothetical protein